MVDIVGQIFFEGRAVEEVKVSARRTATHCLQAYAAPSVDPTSPALEDCGEH